MIIQGVFGHLGHGVLWVYIGAYSKATQGKGLFYTSEPLSLVYAYGLLLFPLLFL